MPSKRKRKFGKKQKKRAPQLEKRITSSLVGIGHWLRANRVTIGVVVLLLLAGVGAAFVLQQDRGSHLTTPEASGKSKGDPNAPVVVEVYADFQCPWCRRFTLGPERLLEEEYVRRGKVLLVFRHFAFLGEESRWAAEAAECANEQGRFWDYHDKLFEEQSGENVGTFRKENLKRFAAELGLDTQQFNQCLDSGKYAAKVQEEILEGRRRGVRGTPTVFINGQLLERGLDYSSLREAVEAELKRAEP